LKAKISQKIDMRYLKSSLIKPFLISISALIFCASFKSSTNKNVFVVVLDAGHGGDDGGARGYDGIREKDITLRVTLAVGHLINTNFKDVKVVYTRDTDVFIPLQERARIANRNKADLFISIHCNANSRSEAFGTETFVLGLHRNNENFEVSKRENSVIFLEDNYEETYEGFDPRSPASVIGLTLLQNTHLDNSIQFAKLMEDNFILSDRTSRGVKQAGFLVLRQTAMPSVLIEMGFISNPEEGVFLGTEEGISSVAEDIFASFSTYRQIVQNKANLSNLPIKTQPKTKEPTVFAAKQIDKTPEIIQPPKKIEAKTEIIPKKPTQSLVYKIQLLHSKKLIEAESPLFNGLAPIEITKEPNGYKYYYGQATEEAQKKELLKKVRNFGFRDAFVVKFTVPK
jgi:N-acetylmuramoyl-L-alanine amidase